MKTFGHTLDVHARAETALTGLEPAGPVRHSDQSVCPMSSIAFESQRMAVPDAKFIELRAGDYERCGLTDDVKITLTDRDITRAKQIAAYPWFKEKKDWQREIKKMLSNGFKMEVESLIGADIGPARILDRHFSSRIALFRPPEPRCSRVPVHSPYPVPYRMSFRFVLVERMELGFPGRALHWCSESSAVEPDEGQRGNVGSTRSSSRDA